MRIFLFLSLLLFPIQAHAIPKAMDEEPALGCTPSPIRTASIVLQDSDQKTLNQVRALKSFLAERGQDTTLIDAIYKASLKTGVDFDLLVLKAFMESDLGRLIKAPNSSATGVFQYIDSTWLGVMKQYGKRLGYQNYAQAVSYNRYGMPIIRHNNKYLRAEILAMRYDYEIMAMVKAYQTLDETAMIRKIKGSKVNTTDHYIAHMLGMPLAKEFYTLKRRNSPFALAKIGNPAMREATRMNKSFFFKNGRPLNAAQSYKRFEARVGREMKKIKALTTKKPSPC